MRRKNSRTGMVKRILCIVGIVLMFSSSSILAAENTNDKDDNVYSEEYLEEYFEQFNIKADKIDFSDKVEKLLAENNEVMGVKKEGGLFSKEYYAVSRENPDFFYIGKTKKNKPDGFGILFEEVGAGIVESTDDQGVEYYELALSDYLGERIYKKLYVGYFNKGSFHGEGIQYYPLEEMQAENMSWNIPISAQTYDIYQNDIQALVDYAGTPVEYKGKFKDGKWNGKGTKVTYLVDETKIKEVVVGKFKDNKENGRVKDYFMGCLLYEGETKGGMANGSGKEYYIPDGQLKYEGKYKKGEYNGKGTLYNQDGSVEYNGKWKMGDYAH